MGGWQRQGHILTKTVGNWVDGDRFFNREDDPAALQDHVREGTHRLITAQRRMGKTSLVPQLLRFLDEREGIRTVFVDLEDARDPADAIVEISLESRSLLSLRQRAEMYSSAWLRRLKTFGLSVEHSEMKVQVRARVHSGNWKRTGDRLLKNLTQGGDVVVLAIDELPLPVSRILRWRGARLRVENIGAADVLLSWLRRNAQTHRGRLCLIASGSVGIAPILKQAGPSAATNVFSAYDLKPWSETTASACLEDLASTYGVDLPANVREALCRRLRSCVPHHVQQFFDALHRHLRITGRSDATLEDADVAYREDMLGTRGQIDMDHYEDRLRLVLGTDGYKVALEFLARAAAEGTLGTRLIDKYLRILNASGDTGAESIEVVLDILVHDGYFVRRGEEFRFESGLLEDWQRARRGLPVARLAES